MTNYYAVIPAYVRYNLKLNPNTILLYGEITALCNTDGICKIDKEYFALLYNVSKASITRWLNTLMRYGYILFTPTENKNEVIIHLQTGGVIGGE